MKLQFEDPQLIRLRKTPGKLYAEQETVGDQERKAREENHDLVNKQKS